MNQHKQSILQEVLSSEEVQSAISRAIESALQKQGEKNTLLHVGDVVKILNSGTHSVMGKEGIIRRIDCTSFPYLVETYNGECIWFRATDLEKSASKVVVDNKLNVDDLVKIIGCRSDQPSSLVGNTGKIIANVYTYIPFLVRLDNSDGTNGTMERWFRPEDLQKINFGLGEKVLIDGNVGTIVNYMFPQYEVEFDFGKCWFRAKDMKSVDIDIKENEKEEREKERKREKEKENELFRVGEEISSKTSKAQILSVEKVDSSTYSMTVRLYL